MAPQFRNESWSIRPPRSFHRNRADARRYERSALIYMGVIQASLGIAIIGIVPLWVLAPIITIGYVRGALLTHELMHVRRPEQIHWLLRMMMLYDTPLGLGYREYQSIHFHHHQKAATEADPEYFQIRGTPLRALLAAMVSSEIAVIRWVQSQGISPQLGRDATIRSLCMLAMGLANPTVFFAYWIMIRLTIGVSNFIFHHALHARQGVLGTFSLRLPRTIDTIVRVSVGPILVPVLCDHDAHHAWPNVKPERLPGLLAVCPARASTTHASLAEGGR